MRTAMELKVWVDGIQRVVCGATFDTTCQDVVIALAHAMGRTGRFSLVERWRDNDRPLTPAECPLQVLHKWGEYAAEVRFVLCQADSQCMKRVSQDRLAKKVLDRSGVPHATLPPHVQGSSAVDSSVKRSLTFSGAHNKSSEGGSAMLNSSAPTSKFRKTHMGPVPNRETNCQNGARQTVPRQAGVSGGGDGHQVRAPSTLQQPQYPVAAARHRPAPRNSRPSPSEPVSALQFGGDASRVSAFQPPQSSRSHPVSPSSRAAHPGQSLPPPLHSHQQPLPDSQPQAHSNPQHNHQNHHHQQSKPCGPDPQPPPRRHHPSRPPSRPSESQDQNQRIPSLPHHPPTVDPQPPPLPKSPPPSLPVVDGHDQLAVTPMETSDHSHQASLEIEEYDLDNNFPDTHRDSSHYQPSEVSLEYRLEDGLGSSGQLEGEHAKLMRLVNMQQERLKTQESQISLVNTEISTLEEEDKEYEENLHVIMEELLLQENRQRDLEPQLADLEHVEWDTVLEGEKQQEVDLTLKIASCKAMLLEQEHRLDDVKSQEKELLEELKGEEESLQQEREQLKEKEKRAREEEKNTKDHISQLQQEFTDLQKQSADCETSLAAVESELNTVEESLQEKSEVLKGIEADLKVQNLKDFTAHPVPTESSRTKDNEPVIMKILEGQLSPRFHKNSSDNASSPLLAALAATKQSGVWV